MAYNINKLFEIAKLLDTKGKYSLSDKVDNFIKTSQSLLPTLPSVYQPTSSPVTGNPFIDSMFQNMSDTAAGSQFAGGGMYDRFSPYKSKMGPNAPGILPTITPAQLAELSKTEKGREYLAQMQLRGGLKATNYENLSNAGLTSFAKLVDQFLNPGVAKEVQQSFLNDTFPGALTGQLSNILTRFPINEWLMRLNPFYNLASKYPQHSAKITQSINTAAKSALENLRYHDPVQYEKIIKDPKFKPFQAKFNFNI